MVRDCMVWGGDIFCVEGTFILFVKILGIRVTVFSSIEVAKFLVKSKMFRKMSQAATFS